MQIGTLDIVRTPPEVRIDGSAMRRENLHQFKPAELTIVISDEARAKVGEAIQRIVAEGDTLKRIENKGRAIPALAAQGFADAAGELQVQAATPPSVTWVMGVVRIEFRPAVDLYL
ncbi:MAG: DUF6470 family protein [Chitinophagales bacterium]